MTEDFNNAVKLAEKHDILDHRKLRDHKVREMYSQLRKDFVKYEDAIELIAHKFNVSGYSIEKIISNKSGTTKGN